MLTYDFRLPPGPRTIEYALLAEHLGFRAIWCPEVPAFGHDIWVTLSRIAEKTNRIKFGPSVLIPSYRHPMAQASAIATLEQIAPGRLMVGFGTGFTGRAGMGKKPLSLASMRTHIGQVKALLRGDIADIDGGLAQILASDGWLPDRPINAPIYMAGQGPKARALAKEIADGLIPSAVRPKGSRPALCRPTARCSMMARTSPRLAPRPPSDRSSRLPIIIDTPLIRKL